MSTAPYYAVTGTRVPGQRLRPDTFQCRRCGRFGECQWDRKPATCHACALDAEREASFPAQGWALDALCAQVGTEVFFPERGGANRAAKAVCGRCDVRAECLSWALATGQPNGVWGGLSAAERGRVLGGAA